MAHKNPLFANVSDDSIELMIHSFGHILVAKHFQTVWDGKIDGDIHQFNPVYSNTSEYEKNFSTAVIYMAGSAAENIYFEERKITPSKRSSIRLFNDLKFAHPHIIEILRADKEMNFYPDFTDIPIEICSKYINCGINSLESIAEANNQSPLDLIERGAAKIFLNYTKSNLG